MNKFNSLESYISDSIKDKDEEFDYNQQEIDKSKVRKPNHKAFLMRKKARKIAKRSRRANRR